MMHRTQIFATRQAARYQFRRLQLLQNKGGHSDPFELELIRQEKYLWNAKHPMLSFSSPIGVANFLQYTSNIVFAQPFQRLDALTMFLDHENGSNDDG